MVTCMWSHEEACFCYSALLIETPVTARPHPAPQQVVDGVADVRVHPPPVALQNLDGDVKRRRRGALQHRFLDAAPARLLVAQRHRLDAADQVVQRGVLEQVAQLVACAARTALEQRRAKRGRFRGLFEA